MIKKVLRLCAALILFSAIVFFQPGGKKASAQSVSVTWMPPIQLSDPHYQAWPPSITTDIAGNVHILWSQTMLSGQTIGSGDTLYYARWSGDKWVGPVDVLVSPESGLGAEFPDLIATPDGFLHAVWGTGGQNSRLYYSRAPACCAEDPFNWSKPVQLGIGVNQTSAIGSDGHGNLYVIYAALDTKDIVFIHSEDDGETWDKAVSIPAGLRREDDYPAYPRLSVSESGRIHVVWSILPYPGRAVMYSSSDDGGKTWKEPLTIDDIASHAYQTNYGPTLIDVEAVGKEEVHLNWDGAPTVERHHVWSKDGGETWSAPDTFIPELTGGGRALWNDMAVDSSGVLHAVSIKQPWHAQWADGNWSQSTAISQRGFAEDMRIAISGGNVLHVVWLEVKQDVLSSVYYVRGISSAPAVPLQKLPEVASDLQFTQIATIPTPTATATVTPTAIFAGSPGADVRPISNPVVGVLPAAAVVIIFLGLLIFSRYQKRG